MILPSLMNIVLTTKMVWLFYILTMEAVEILLHTNLRGQKGPNPLPQPQNQQNICPLILGQNPMNQTPPKRIFMLAAL